MAYSPVPAPFVVPALNISMSDNQIIEETIHKRLQYKFDRQLTKFASEYLRLGQIEDPAEAKKAAAALLEDVAQL